MRRAELRDTNPTLACARLAVLLCVVEQPGEGELGLPLAVPECECNGVCFGCECECTRVGEVCRGLLWLTAE